MTRLSKQLFLSVALVLLFAGGASATPVCTNDTDLHQYVCYDSFDAAAGDFGLSVPLPQFDASLGTLVNIEHFASAHIVANLSITNSSPDPQEYDVTAKSTVRMRYGSATGTALVTVIPLYADTVSVNSGQTLILSPTGDASGTGTSYAAPFSPTIQSQYIGDGDVPFYVTVKTSSGIIGSGEYVFNPTITTNGIAQVIYTYAATEIPEPATVFLMGSSLLALGFMRKLKTLSA